MKVYESVIEVCLEPAFKDARNCNDDLIRKLRSLRQKHEDISVDLVVGCGLTQERALLDLLWQRACLSDKAAGRIGYVGYDNCVFKLLYGIFGIDILAFLFGQSWVPAAIIHAFNPDLFLERLSVLERAITNLKDGTKLPVVLPEAKEYIQLGMGPTLNFYLEEEHHLLTECSLQELRDFGELARSLRDKKQELHVNIHIWEYDDEVLAFAAEPEKYKEIEDDESID